MEAGRSEETRAPASHAQVVEDLTRAEQEEGWLARCEAVGEYLSLTLPLLAALADVLRPLVSGPVLEVCAGDGSLARGLQRTGIAVTATDLHPAGAGVRVASARDALLAFEPTLVIGSFVPFDSGIDRLVLEAPSVQHYLVLNARLGGELGARELWMTPGWRRRELSELSRWMITRHDQWIRPGAPLLQRGEAWLLTRALESGRNPAPDDEEGQTGDREPEE